MLALWKKNYDKPRQYIKKQRHTLLTKVHTVKAMVFPVVMYGYESWTIKKAKHQRIDAFELWCWRRLLRVLDNREIKSVSPKENQPWIFIGRTDVEAEAPIFRPPDAKSQLIRKDPDAGKDWRQEKKGVTEDEMVGWHHRLNGHEFEQTGRWWRTAKPGVLQSMVLKRVEHDLTTEQQNEGQRFLMKMKHPNQNAP